MQAGNSTRVTIAPTVRIMTSNINGDSYVRIYLPILEDGTTPGIPLSQSVTLNGNNVSQHLRKSVTEVSITVAYPAADQGFDSDFFKFYFNNPPNTYILDAFSDPPLASDSFVEFYLGEVAVSLGIFN
jgi:hypothetical protein